jgi:hypothetical protein
MNEMIGLRFIACWIYLARVLFAVALWFACCRVESAATIPHPRREEWFPAQIMDCHGFRENQRLAWRHGSAATGLPRSSQENESKSWRGGSEHWAEDLAGAQQPSVHSFCDSGQSRPNHGFAMAGWWACTGTTSNNLEQSKYYINNWTIFTDNLIWDFFYKTWGKIRFALLLSQNLCFFFWPEHRSGLVCAE